VSKSNKKGRKSNSVKNMKKKKKQRAKEKTEERATQRDIKHKIQNICDNFKKISTTQAIVRHKLRNEENRLNKDMKSICKGFSKLLETKTLDVSEDEKKEKIAIVEDLSSQVEDLMINRDDNPEELRPGFVYTRWQQKKFLEGLKLLKTNKVNSLSDFCDVNKFSRRQSEEASFCCESPNLCLMHRQNLH